MEIRQIIQADGWAAVSYGRDEGGEGYPLAHPLIAWALLEDGTVVGLLPNNNILRGAPEDREISQAEYGVIGFLGYAENSEEKIERFRPKAREAARRPTGW